MTPQQKSYTYEELLQMGATPGPPSGKSYTYEELLAIGAKPEAPPMIGAEGVTNKIGAPNIPSPPQGYGETIMNRLTGMVGGVKQAGKEWLTEAQTPFVGPIAATGNALIGKPIAGLMKSLAGSEDLAQGLVRLAGLGPGLDEAVEAIRSEGNVPKALGIMTTDYLIPTVAGSLTSRVLAAGAGMEAGIPKLTSRNAKAVVRTYPGATATLKEIERTRLNEVSAATSAERAGVETWTANRIAQNIEEPMQLAVQRLENVKKAMGYERELAAIEQRGVNKVRQVQLQSEMKAAETEIEAAAQRDVNAFVQTVGRKLNTEEVAYGTEVAHRGVIRDFTDATNALYEQNKQFMEHPSNISQVPTEKTMSGADIFAAMSHDIELPPTTPINGAIPIEGVKDALRADYEAERGALLALSKREGNPGATAIINLMDGPDILRGTVAQQALTTLNHFGWNVADPMLTTNSLRLLRNASYAMRDAMEVGVSGYSVGSSEIAANLTEAKLLFRAREKMVLVPPAREGLAAVERAGSVIKLINDPRGFRAYWQAVSQDPWLQASARREVAEWLMGKSSRDFAVNYNSLHPEIRDLVFSPEQQTFAKQVAAGNENAVMQVAVKYEQDKINMIHEAVNNSKDIVEKKRTIARIETEIQDIEAKAGVKKGEARAERRTRLNLLKQRETQFKQEIQSDFDSKYRALSEQYTAAEERLNVLRRRRRIAWYGIGALGLWKMRNAMEAITSTLGGPGR